MECIVCKKIYENLSSEMICELCFAQACMDDDGGAIRILEVGPKRVTKGDRKAKRRYNRYRRGGGKGRRGMNI